MFCIFYNTQNNCIYTVIIYIYILYIYKICDIYIYILYAATANSLLLLSHFSRVRLCATP